MNVNKIYFNDTYEIGGLRSINYITKFLFDLFCKWIIQINITLSIIDIKL